LLTVSSFGPMYGGSYMPNFIKWSKLVSTVIFGSDKNTTS